MDHLGQSAYGDFICVPKTAQQLLADPEGALQEIASAVQLAAERGAKIVGLGAYTSVVTMGGRQLLPHTKVALTTGNSYTVVSGVEALLEAAKRLEIDVHCATGVVVGAGGAIGKALALLLSEQVQKLILVGNPARPKKSEYRMLKVVAEIIGHLKEMGEAGHSFAEDSLGAWVQSLRGIPSSADSLTKWVDYVQELLNKPSPVRITISREDAVPKADLLMVATSSLEALITPELLKRGAVVCDLSRPSNVSEAVLRERPDVLVIDGGIVAMPNSPDLGWNFGFEKEQDSPACRRRSCWPWRNVMSIRAWGGSECETAGAVPGPSSAQGFTLAGFRNLDRPLDPLCGNVCEHSGSRPAPKT